MKELDSKWWRRQYPQFMRHDLGSPCSPIPNYIMQEVLDPVRFLEAVNAIGCHTLDRSAHCPSISTLERAAIDFSVSLVDENASPSDWSGYVCSGATLANIHALLMASQRAAKESRELVVRSSGAAHYSLRKALLCAGLNEHKNLVLRQTEPQQGCSQTLYLDWLTFGDIETGTFETPDSDLGDNLCHVDAAYGGLLSGMSQLPSIDLSKVSSFVVDYHKTGRLPPSRSVFCVRSDILRNSSLGLAHIPNSIDRTLEGSRSLASVAQIASYASRVGLEGHRCWIDEIDALTREVHNSYEPLFGKGIVWNSANILFLDIEDWSPEVQSCCYQYNVSRAWADGLPINTLRMFCWPDHGYDIYLRFAEELAGCAKRSTFE